MPEVVGDLVVKVTGDASDLDKAFRDAERSANAAAEKIGSAFTDGFSQANKGAYEFIDSAQKIIDKQRGLEVAVTQAKGALADISLAYQQGAATAVDMVRAQENLVSAMNAANVSTKEGITSNQNFGASIEQWINNPLQTAGSAAKGFVETLGPMGVAAGLAATAIAAVGGAIVSLVLEEGKAAEQTSNLADKLNLSYEDTKKLSEMSLVAGVNIGVLERVSARLAVALEDSGGSGKKVALALDELGIYGSDSGEVLMKLLTHLAAIPDATERIAIANQVMGRQAAVALEPMLKDFNSIKAAVEALGGTLSKDMVAALKAVDDASDHLSIAWNHFKEALAATFSGPVQAGLELLTRLLTGPAEAPVEARIASLISEINKLKLASDSAGASMNMAMTGGLSGGAFTNQGAIQQKESELKRLQELPQSQKEAIARSREYNDEIDKSNRAAELYKQGEVERTNAAIKGANDRARAAYRENQEAVALYKAQQAEVKALDDALKFFHVTQSDPALEHAKLLMGQLNLAYQFGKVSLKDLTAAQSDYNKVFGYDYTTYVEKALTLVEQMDQKFQKVNQSLEHQRELLRSPEFAGRAKEVLGELNANVPFDAEMEARRKGTPLGDALLRSRISRDDGSLQQITDLTAIMAGGSMTEINLKWVQAQGAMKQMAQVDLPAVIALYQQYIGIQQQDHAAVGRIAILRQQELQLIIQEKTLRNESVTEYMIQLEQLQIAEQMRIEKLQFWGNLYKDLMKDIQSISGMVTNTLVDQIVQIDKNDSAWMKLGKNIEKMFLETIIGSVLKQLSNKLIEMSGLASKLGGLFGGGGGGGSFGGFEGMEAAGAEAGSSALKDIGKIGKSLGAAGEDVGSSGGGFLSGLQGAGSPMDFVNAGITAAAGITAGLQAARMINLLSGIEISTRATKEQITGGTQTVLNTYLPELVHLVDIWGALDSGPLGQIRDILWYGKINVNVVRGEGGTGSANDVLNGGFEPALPPKPPVGQGTVVEPIEAPELTRFEANSRRGLGNFNVGSLSAIVDGLEKAAKAIDKTADVFAGSGLTPTMTTAQALASGAARLGISVEQFKAFSDKFFDQLNENDRRGMSRSDVYQPVFGNTSIFADDSKDPNKQAQLKSIRDSLELYRAGNISYAAHISNVNAATDKYQLTIASLDTLISRFGRLSDASSAEAKTIRTLIEAQGGVFSTPGVTAGYFGGGRMATNLSGFSEAFQAIQGSGFGGTADLGNSSFINAAMMRGDLPGMGTSEKSAALNEYATMLRQEAEIRAQQTVMMLDGMQTLAGIQFAKAFEAATAGRNIRMDSTGRFFQLDQAGNLIDADTGKALLNYEQLYNQFANPTGVPTGMQGTQDVTRTNSFGGTTRLAANLRAYAASPVDYSAMLQNYSAGLNTQYVGANAQQYAGGMFAPITMNVYTNDPQVVANQLTNSLWSSGYKTR